MRKMRGITLISLVVTILVILILSGVAIATLTGNNGIIKNATKAKESSEKSALYEQISIATKSAVSTKTLKLNENKFKQALTSSLGAEGTGYTITGDSEKGWVVTVNNISFVVNEEAKIWNLEDISSLINNSDTTKNEKTNKTIAVRDSSNPTEIFFLPESFKIASDSATMVDEGIVVEDEEGNQFVWVPVPDVIQKRDENGNLIAPSWNDENPKASYTPMATTYIYENSSVKGTLYRGMLYDFSATKSTYKSGYRIGTTSYREPSLVTGNNDDKWSPMKIITGTDYDAKSDYTQTILGFTGTDFAFAFGKQMQEDYNEMVKSINTCKGFFVGRFETGYELIGETRKTTSKPASSTVLTADATVSKDNMWYGLYKMQQNFATNKKVKSSMIWGSQYDAMLNWMLKAGISVGTSPDTETINSSVLTGNKNTDILNNIYDLYGCHRELTLEAFGNDSRSKRGGHYTYIASPAKRYYDVSDSTSNSYGSRLTLHIVE